MKLLSFLFRFLFRFLFITLLTLMFVLLFTLFLNGLSEKLDARNHFESKSIVLCESDTVIYVQSKILEKIRDNLNSLEDGILPTCLKVYQDKISKDNLVYQDTKTSEENTFFFTATKRGTYHIVLLPAVVDEILKQSLSIDCKVYTGEANRPHIVSGNDVEVRKAEDLIREILKYVEENLVLQNLNNEDEIEYLANYSYFTKKILVFMVVRIISIIFTILCSNYLTKKFYASQGVLAPKK